VSDKPERLEPEQVDKSVVYHIYGDNNVIASTAQTINQAGRDIVINGDAQSLINALVGFGVEQADADEIIRTLSEGSRGPSLGQKAMSLIKTAGAKVAAAGGAITASAATSVITKLVLQYIGMG
jgi:hypothetical protein